MIKTQVKEVRFIQAQLEDFIDYHIAGLVSAEPVETHACANGIDIHVDDDFYGHIYTIHLNSERELCAYVSDTDYEFDTINGASSFQKKDRSANWLINEMTTVQKTIITAYLQLLKEVSHV